MDLSAERLAERLSLGELGRLKQRVSERLQTTSLDVPLRLARLDDAYVVEELINHGTYGYVWRARRRRRQQGSDDGEVVALKQIKIQPHASNVGFPIQALREIHSLQALQGHPHIVNLYEVVVREVCQSWEVFLAIEYFDTDVKRVLPRLDLDHARQIFYQVLLGLSFIHVSGYMHRDLKWGNVLLNAQTGRVVLADFGMCRRENAGRRYSFVVVTLHYRSPELLMLQDQYVGSAVDMWSMGCMLYELINRGEVLFPGASELEQLNLIWEILGTPNQDPQDWRRGWLAFPPMLHKLGLELREQNERKLAGKEFPLLERMLALDPGKRITASEALTSEWFVKSF
ncbi:hypothetical protein BASA81_002057 [Batrachochytrium salamandrivorans]|nr:hypothetical protein BASA81_002057 [Batrachochytrium salamandrivorans]